MSFNFRLFLSSTFSDFQIERNALEIVFHGLEVYCAERGSSFEVVDLRWGVNPEVIRDQRTLDVCLEEIDRCRTTSPELNFLVLLGERVGWRPLPASIPADDMDLLLNSLPQHECMFVKKWYRRDDNAMLAEWVLQSRLAEMDGEEWTAIENGLRLALVGAAKAADLAPAHYRDWGDSVTFHEIRRAVLDPFAVSGRSVDSAFCFVRRAVNADIEPSEYKIIKTLGTDLANSLPKGNIRSYEARWRDGSIAQEDVEGFCVAVEACLKQRIDEVLAKSGPYEPVAESPTLPLT